MATYLKAIDVNAGFYVPPAGAIGVLSQVVTVGTADLVESGTLDIGYLPANAKVVDVVMTATDMDSASSPAIVIDLGDAGDPDRFINASTVGQTGTTIRAGNDLTTSATWSVHGGFAEPTLIYATIVTAPGTAVAGTLMVNVIYEVLEAGVA